MLCREEGTLGLFAGLEAKLLQTVLTAAVTLVTYEKLLTNILTILQQSQTSKQQQILPKRASS